MIPQYLSKRPWIFVTAAFLGFVVWWGFFITLAVKNLPPEVPLVTRPHAPHAGH